MAKKVLPERLLALAGTLFFLSIPAVAAQAQLLEAKQTLIEMDASWRYYDNEDDPGLDWREIDFDDSEWKEAPALLGYDTSDRAGSWPEPGLQTRVKPNRLTYYFRTEFDFSGSTEGIKLQLDQIVDDGAVYYLNGTEIGRSRFMPEGNAGHDTRAIGYTNPEVEADIMAVDASLLREGRNVLAASVHNQAVSSSDIAFGARLTVSEGTVPPVALYLTWQRDPTTTMTIQWHTEHAEEQPSVSFGLIGSGEELQEAGSSHPMSFSHRHIHTVELTGLNPGSTYWFRILSSESGRSSPLYKFRTMPATADRPIRMAVGGDIQHHQEWMEETNRQAMRFDLDFIAWGGDLAYANGREDQVHRWYAFFDAFMKTLITEDGRVVPVLVAIGNHEVRGSFYWGNDRGREGHRETSAFSDELAPYYFNIFAFPGHPGYGVIDFGDYMSFILLNTDHTAPVQGRQTEWLEEVLAERAAVPHLFPLYHVPAFPSVRGYGGEISNRIREHWVPLFERYGVGLAFENHDHAYKRTAPILGGKIDSSGVVYLGDGAWGVVVRPVHEAEDTWYLERSESIRHFILVTIQDDFQEVKAISHEGALIDHYIPRRRKAAARE